MKEEGVRITLGNLFSIKKVQKHEVFTLLGFKIKVKQKNKDDGLNNFAQSCNNHIIIVENGREYELHKPLNGLNITLKGKNNTIKIHKPINFFNNVHIEIGNDNTYMEIKENCYLTNLHIRACFGDSQKCIIGHNTTIYGGSIILDEKSGCIIGDNCLFAGGFQVWASDGHTIYDILSHKVLNTVKSPVKIGRHVWAGLSVSILKNTEIADNTVIGQNSICTGVYKETNTVIAGNPAKVIKRNINWDAVPPFLYENNINK